MIDSKEALAKIVAMKENETLTRRDLARMVDCSLGNILDAQRTGKLVGTLVEENGVKTFRFSRNQLMAWRQSSGKQTGFGRITINVQDEAELKKVQKVLSDAGVSFTCTLKK